VNTPSLLSLSKGSGCGCKINPEALKQLLQGLTCDDNHPGLLVGNSLSDDCSVFDLGNGQLLLQTVDFFTPMVNDAFTFGSAAAANALSDIWAMGGKPIMANAVFSWPLDVLPIEMGREVMRGAQEICKQAGVALAGGHSIDGREPLFGLSVMGLCDTANLKRNSTAVSGDVIILTKPLGIGMLAAAHKRAQSTPEQDATLFRLLSETNHAGEALGKLSGVHALTDVTGFGLAGHLLEICRGSGLGAVIQASTLPCIAEAQELAKAFVLPDNAMRNWNSYQKEIDMQSQDAFCWLVDPQTNGGLLAAVSPQSLDLVKSILIDLGVPCFELGFFSSELSGLRVSP
jgi:selenide,water dikinase